MTSFVNQPTIKNRSISINTIQFYNSGLDYISSSIKQRENDLNILKSTPLVAEFSVDIPEEYSWLVQLKTIFANYQLPLIGISLANQSIKNPELFIKANLAIIPNQQRKNSQQEHSPQNSLSALVINKSLRSGQRIYAEKRDVIVIGTVNSGAEVLADGNVIIFGTLRGRAVAGARGDKSSFIYVSAFQAELIAIAGNYHNMENLAPQHGREKLLIRFNEMDRIIDYSSI